MAVLLLRAYGNYASGTTVILAADTESTLVAQGLATAVTNGASASSIVGGPDMYATTGGVVANMPQSGQGVPSVPQGPLTLPCISLGSVALTTFETNGVAQVAGTMNLTEIYVPYAATWTGAGILNGTTVGTHNVLTALYGSNGVLLANSAVAGVLSANASVFQNIPYTSPIPLPPGRYFLGFQYSGTTPTPRHLLAANGAGNITGTVAGTFGTIPASITVPTTFTTAVGPICQMYV
jgi:hypothetical protein